VFLPHPDDHGLENLNSLAAYMPLDKSGLNFQVSGLALDVSKTKPMPEDALGLPTP
jgi:hypothetical protein